MSGLGYQRRDDGVTLFVRLTPKAGRDGIDGFENRGEGVEVLKARVRAVPEDGKANRAVIALIAVPMLRPLRLLRPRPHPRRRTATIPASQRATRSASPSSRTRSAT